MSFRQDLSQTFRSLGKAPGFSFIVIVTLALGVAGNTAVFSVIHVVLLRPLPFPDSAHLWRLFEAKTPNDSATRSGVSPGNFIDWQEQNRAFKNLAAAQSFHYNLTGDGAPEHVWGGAVSAAWFAVLGVQPLLGRDFRLDEDGPVGAPVVILSEQIWRRRYLADTEIIGKTIGVNGDSFTVIGVMPAKADYREDIELWIPLHRQIRPDRMLWRDSRFLHVLARARPGVTLRQAADDLNRIAADVRAAHPSGDIYGAATIERLQEVLTSDVQGMLLVSLATVALVLLVASANIALLMLLRTTGRTRELAIRMALGARVGSLLRQLVLEGMCLSALGGFLGLGAGVAGKKLLPQLLSWGSPELDAIDLGWPVLIFNFGVSLAAGVLFALVPAVAVLRGEMQDVLNRASFVTAGGTKGRRLRQGFVIAEIACSLVLLAGAGLLVRSFQVLRHVSLGFSTDHRAVALISLPRTRYQSDIAVVQFFQKVGDRVRALPEVEDATITYPLPLFDGGFGSSFQLIQQAAPAEQFYNVDLRLVDSHSLSTLSVPLLRGRTIADSDHSDSEPVCVINRAMAQRYWPGQEPLGQLIVLTRLDVSGAASASYRRGGRQCARPRQ